MVSIWLYVSNSNRILLLKLFDAIAIAVHSLFPKSVYTRWTLSHCAYRISPYFLVNAENKRDDRNEKCTVKYLLRI